MSKPLMSKTQNICLIILAGLFLLLGFFMVNHLLKNNKEKETKYTEIAIDSDEVKKAMTPWNISYCMGVDDLVKGMYKEEFKTKSIGKEYLLYLSLESFNTIPACTTKEEKVTITLDEINKHLKNILKDKSLNHEEIKSIIGGGKLNHIYNLSFDGNNLIVAKSCYECTNNTEGTLTKIDKVEKNNKYLVVYQKFAFGKEIINEEGNILIDYYKDINTNKYVERLSQEDAGNLDWDKYDTYKLIFEIVDENYLLEKVVKD